MKKQAKAAGNPVDVYQMVTDRILKQIEETGTLTWVKPWKYSGVSNSFPMNGKTKRRYDGVNFFLLQLAGYSSPYWLTFKQIEEMKGSIKKGEKATQVVFWKINTYKEVNPETQEEKNKQVPLLRYYNVFNIEQCEGIEIAHEAAKTPYAEHTPIERSEFVINQYGQLQPSLKLRVEESSEAYYMPGWDLVNMPLIHQFESPEAYYSVFFHELGHSTGHADRLHRKEVAECARFGSCDYGQEELTAELTAAFICAQIGISNETTERRSSAYIQNWKKRIKADKKMFIMAAGRAAKAANLILNIGDSPEVTE